MTASPHPSQCHAKLPTALVAGDHSFDIEVKDKYGNLTKSNNALLKVAVIQMKEKNWASITNIREGVYRAHLLLRNAGNATVMVLLEEVHINESPFNVKVSPSKELCGI